MDPCEKLNNHITDDDHLATADNVYLCGRPDGHGGSVPQARDQRGYFLQLEGQVRGTGNLRSRSLMSNAERMRRTRTAACRRPPWLPSERLSLT
jgi:hypothetical protein